MPALLVFSCQTTLLLLIFDISDCLKFCNFGIMLFLFSTTLLITFNLITKLLLKFFRHKYCNKNQFKLLTQYRRYTVYCYYICTFIGKLSKSWLKRSSWSGLRNLYGLNSYQVFCCYIWIRSRSCHTCFCILVHFMQPDSFLISMIFFNDFKIIFELQL